ncbi:uncharacterized protein yc1106_08771 [Curvularia clavata]|uniref:P-type ATPase A domain-containing protein n=1 Tax=Curvularia clavata TaxID=95742 RepID=A0A9Q8ZGE5_CURCL|nr:uncharacterized protein yc1106_08771 [Curvularia clavata]
MEMRIILPKRGTDHAEKPKLTSDQSRSLSPITPNPHTTTNRVRDSHPQTTKPSNHINSQAPHISHVSDTGGFGCDGTPPERASHETVRRNLSDVYLSTSEVPPDMPAAQGQYDSESKRDSEMPVVDSRAEFDRGNLEPTAPWSICAHTDTHIPKEGGLLQAQLESCQSVATLHRPFGLAPSCCSMPRPAFAPGGVQCFTNDLPPMKNVNVKTTCDRTIGNDNDDAEKGPPRFERVVLRINGLKCGCCGRGLSQALERIAAIRNYNVNAVLGRIEFDIDVNHLSVEDVIKLLTKRTGYDLEEHVASDGQMLELLTAEPRRLTHASRPKGVLRVEVPERAPWRPFHSLSRCNKTILTESTGSTICGFASDDDTTEDHRKDPTRGIPKVQAPSIKVYYDPTKIGARDVFEQFLQYDPDLRLAPPTVDPGIELGAKQTRRALLLFLPTLACTIPVLVFAWAPIKQTRSADLHASLVLATLVQIVAFAEFVPNAWRSLCHSRVLEMDFLITLSTTMAYSFSVVSYVLEVHDIHLQSGSLFETSALLVMLILLGRLFSEFARFQAAKSVSFRSLQVEETLLVLPSPNDTWASVKTTRIDSRLLQYGDVFVVPPYTRVVTDGIVLYGGSNVDESMLTGEFKPKAKGLSSVVLAGTNNQDGSLVVGLRKLPHENSVNQIATLVENAELSKPKAQGLADRVAGWFVPAIAMIGTAVFVFWLLVERLRHHHTWRMAVVTSATYTIATLVVSCPCAIGLAVPMVVLIASGVAARYGIILRDPQTLENAYKVTDVVFHKTGTLTCGKLEVVGVPRYHSTDRARIKGLMTGLLKDIKHPVAAAIVHYLANDRILNKSYDPLEVSDIVSFPGKGVQGTCVKTGVVVRAGNADWLKINIIGQETNTRCYFTIAGDLQASFELKDKIRPGAEMVIEKLHTRQVRVHMISGDTEGAVDEDAGALHIHEDCTKSRCRPDEKRTYIKDLQDQGRIVMFVGDGTNDSVALKQANIGVHVGEGSDVAKSAADIVFMTTRLHDILILLDISGAAYRRMIINFSWSGLYNISAILLAAGAFVPVGNQIRIKPQWAGLGELISVLPVMLIAFQMQWRDYGHAYRLIENNYQRMEVTKSERVIRTRASSAASSAKFLHPDKESSMP